MVEKTCILHIGHGKTGSSAIQTALVRQRGWLAEQGIAYPDHPSFEAAARGMISSGNLDPTDGWVAGMTSRAERAAQPTVLFSNETLFFHLSDRLDELAALSRRLRLRLVLYLRDPVELLFSSYGQAVKRGGFTGSLDDFAPMESHVTLAADLIEACEARGLTVALDNYSRLRRQAVTAFFALLVPDAAPAADPTPAATVNRSLNRFELDLLRALNLRDAALAAHLGDRLVQEFPDIRAERPYFSPEGHAAYCDRVAAAVARLNTHLADDRQLEIEPYKNSRRDAYLLDPAHFAFLAGELGDRLASLTDLPDRFDPATYLAQNPDIEAAGLNPFEHFIRRGIKERRRY